MLDSKKKPVVNLGEVLSSQQKFKGETLSQAAKEQAGGFWEDLIGQVFGGRVPSSQEYESLKQKDFLQKQQGIKEQKRVIQEFMRPPAKPKEELSPYYKYWQEEQQKKEQRAKMEAQEGQAVDVSSAPKKGASFFARRKGKADTGFSQESK